MQRRGRALDDIASPAGGRVMPPARASCTSAARPRRIRRRLLHGGQHHPDADDDLVGHGVGVRPHAFADAKVEALDGELALGDAVAAGILLSATGTETSRVTPLIESRPSIS